jgi:hypothetical protein
VTTKESLHEIIETIDDEQAGMILEYAEMITRLQSPPSPLKHDPMNDFIGMFESETPTDIENFKDEYIAKAIASHFETAE